MSTMTAQQLIRLVREMTPEEKRDFGMALEGCGVSVVLTRKLGTTQRITMPLANSPGGAYIDNVSGAIINGQAYDIPKSEPDPEL